MSYQQGRKDDDPNQPSGGSGHRGRRYGSSSDRRSYSRPQESTSHPLNPSTSSEYHGEVTYGSPSSGMTPYSRFQESMSRRDRRDSRPSTSRGNTYRERPHSTSLPYSRPQESSPYRVRRNYDDPSTSSGYRRPEEHGSSFGRTPYSRPQESYVRESHDYAAAGPSSSSTRPEQHVTEQLEVQCAGESEENRPEQRRRRPRETIYVTRPSSLVTKKGTTGPKITLQTNYFSLTSLPDWHLYKYHVNYEPNEERTVFRKGMLKLHKEKVGPYIYDGSVLYTATRLPDMELLSARKSDNVQIKITIRLVGQMSPDDPQYIQVFNIIMRRCLGHMSFQLIGRNFYDANNKIPIPVHKLELWPGYITSIRQHEYNILMCCHVTHKVMREQTLLDMLRDCHSYKMYDYKNEFCRIVIGIMVITDYNNNTYRIEDVDFDANPSSTFTKKTGETISYQDYYQDKYRIRISDPTQPMLVTRNKPTERNASQGDLVYLIPELCRATGLTDNMRENFNLMKALAAHTHVHPEARMKKLRAFSEKLRKTPDAVQELGDWNMRLGANLVEVQGRVLPPEKLIFDRKDHGNTIVHSNDQGDWSRGMQRAPLLYKKTLNNWVIIGCDRERHNIEGFIDKLMQVSHGLSFTVAYPRVKWVRDDKPSTYTENLEHYLSKDAPDLVFCVVSNNRADRYIAIKKKCCIDRPVPSQVFLQKNLVAKSVMSIATKVAIQMNCKLGGAPWNIENPLNGLMTIGFDICHDTATKGRNFLAMVATVDKTLTQFYSSITPYQNDEERAEQVCIGVENALKLYRKNNKALPVYLIIYRDGVSEGEVQQVYENEVKILIEKKLPELYYGPNFKMTFIIVSKRIHTVLYNSQTRNNPPAGTVVDDVVTSQFKYDFFLVTQKVRQGTISPTAYSVIWDNTGLNADMIQRVTFKLTHLYYNCSNTVRVPAPCHYAQKLSFLVGRYLHRPPDTQLQNQLFFL